MDISTAFLQAVGISRDIYVIPPKEANDPRGLWKLLAPEYGLVVSVRLWYRTSNHVLVSEYHLTRSRFEPTLYFKHQDKQLTFVLVAQVDNHVYAGSEDEVKALETFLPDSFNVGTLDRHNFAVMGCELEQFDTGCIRLTQHARMDDIDLNILNTASGNDRPADRPASKE